MAPSAPPVIDFEPLYSENTHDQLEVSKLVHCASIEHGFFQIVNHGVPFALQESVLQASKELFSLPLEVKEKYNKDLSGCNRGYERLRAQNFEKREKGDLKEGYYFGTDLPKNHPYVLQGKINMGPNTYPLEVPDPPGFKKTLDAYFTAVSEVAIKLLQIIKANLNMDESLVKGFCDTPMAILRLLHYPPQPEDAPSLERGAGAHTDFGCITILLQDDLGGLQVWSRETSEWVDVTPIKGAFVVNLGNLMMRWTNDKYLSNLHRVINKSGKDRYSVPFFFSGNPDFVVECLDSCKDDGVDAKYPPVTVGDWMAGRYADTYGESGKKSVGDLLDNRMGG